MCMSEGDISFAQSERLPILPIDTMIYNTDTSSLSTSHLWDSWLDKQGLNHLRCLNVSLSSSLIFQKYMELTKIIQDVVSPASSPVQSTRLTSTHWKEVALNALTARFWNWHDSLPGALRWNRWGSNLDEVEVNLAAMQ